jgi:hypothetical protein
LDEGVRLRVTSYRSNCAHNARVSAARFTFWSLLFPVSFGVTVVNQAYEEEANEGNGEVA